MTTENYSKNARNRTHVEQAVNSKHTRQEQHTRGTVSIKFHITQSFHLRHENAALLLTYLAKRTEVRHSDAQY